MMIFGMCLRPLETMVTMIVCSGALRISAEAEIRQTHLQFT